jgi:hypothetical protein
MTTSPRGPRAELDERTAHGAVYARRLRRAQLTLALLSLTTFGGLIGSLPILLDRVPALRTAHVLGVPVGVALLAVPPYVLFVALGWLHERRARALDDAFRDLIDER